MHVTSENGPVFFTEDKPKIRENSRGLFCYITFIQLNKLIFSVYPVNIVNY